MANDRSLDDWAQVAGAPGLYQRAGNAQAANNTVKPEQVSQVVKTMRSKVQALIAEANKRSRL